MRAENLISIFLTLDDISEVNQYDFYMEQFSVTPKYIKIPNNKDPRIFSSPPSWLWTKNPIYTYSITIWFPRCLDPLQTRFQPSFNAVEIQNLDQSEASASGPSFQLYNLLQPCSPLSQSESNINESRESHLNIPYLRWHIRSKPVWLLYGTVFSDPQIHKNPQQQGWT